MEAIHVNLNILVATLKISKETGKININITHIFCLT